MGQQVNSYDYYKHLREEEAPEFDRAWKNTAKQIGFNSSTMQNRLCYGSEDHIGNKITSGNQR